MDSLAPPTNSKHITVLYAEFHLHFQYAARKHESWVRMNRQQMVWQKLTSQAVRSSLL